MKNKFILFIFLVIAYSVNATNYYVNSTTGNNSFSGLTPSTAKQTLGWFSYSTTFLHPGDTLFVMNGTYTNGTGSSILNLKASGSSVSPIVITNYPNHTPLLQFNSWAGINLSDSIHHIVINGLKIRGNNANLTLAMALNQPASCSNTVGPVNAAYNGSGIAIDGRTNGRHVHHITVRNCEIFECGNAGIASLQSDYLTYENNLIYNNSWYTIYGGSGISNLNSWNYDSHASSPYSMIIRNNIVYGNELMVPWVGAPCAITDGNGIIIDSQSNLTTSLTPYSGKTLIENNIVYRNGGRGIHIYASANADVRNNTCFFNGKSAAISGGEITVISSTNVTVFNNIMYARTNENANSKNGSTANLTSGYNLLYNGINSTATYTSATDIIGINPQFTDTTNSIFTLKCSSPGLNAGSTLTTQYSPFDINGIGRPLGIKPDIGAYEKLGVPTASISLSSATVCAGQTINLSGSGLNSPGSYTWSLAGGTPANSTIQNPSVYYNTAGTYTVSLITANTSCTSTAVTKTVSIKAKPVLTVTTTSSLICQGNTVTINGSGAATYTWSGGITNNTAFTPTATTIYTLAATAANNCTNSAAITVSVSMCTDITKNNNSDVISIYPNPANNMICISSDQNLTDSYKLILFNNIGQKVFEDNYTDKINIQSLLPGIYFIQLSTQNKIIVTKKIIVKK